jgi:hypothetical protein
MRHATPSLHRLARLATGLGCLAAGCAPVAPPYQVFETAEVLDKKEIGVTAAGGLGFYGEAKVASGPNGIPTTSFSTNNWGGGVGARVRYGLGSRSEIGAEASVLADGPSNDLGKYVIALAAAKVAYKLGILPQLALVLGLGAAEHFGHDVNDPNRTTYDTGLGGDAALIVDPGFALLHLLRPYAGLRLGLSGLVACDHGCGNSGVDVGLLGVLGLSVEPTRSLRLMAEAGVGGLWVCKSDANNGNTCRGYDDNYNFGFYGGVAIAYVFGR